jgi:hypothetical protein
MQDPAPAIQNTDSGERTATPIIATPPQQTRRTRSKKAKRVNGSSSSAAAPADPDAPLTVNISLPGEIYRFFEQEAAEDERTLAKYLQRLVKQVWQQSQQKQEEQRQRQQEDQLIRTEKNIQSGVE